MLYREIIAVCFQIHTKHINTQCGQNVELLNVNLAVHIVTTGLQRVKNTNPQRVHCVRLPYIKKNRKYFHLLLFRKVAAKLRVQIVYYERLSFDRCRDFSIWQLC